MDQREPGQTPGSSEEASAPEEVADQARTRADDLDREFHSRISSVDEKIQANRMRHEAQKKKAQSESMSDPEAAKGLGTGLTVAYAIIGTPIMMFGLGYLIDRAAGTPKDAPLTWAAGLGLLGMIVGVAFAMMVANRANSQP